MLDISPILFVVLGTAALLGFALGYALARWLPDERHASVLGELEARHLAAEQESAARVDVLSTALEREREGVARNRRRWSERELSQASRQETLEAQAKTQQNRIKDLLCEQRSTEERLMRVEQRLATLRQEYGMAERDRSAVMPERPFSGATARSLQSQLDGVTGVHDMNGTEDMRSIGADVPVPLLKRRATPERWDEVFPEVPETELPETTEFDDIVDGRA